MVYSFYNCTKIKLKPQESAFFFDLICFKNGYFNYLHFLFVHCSWNTFKYYKFQVGIATTSWVIQLIPKTSNYYVATVSNFVCSIWLVSTTLDHSKEIIIAFYRPSGKVGLTSSFSIMLYIAKFYSNDSSLTLNQACS